MGNKKKKKSEQFWINNFIFLQGQNLSKNPSKTRNTSTPLRLHSYNPIFFTFVSGPGLLPNPHVPTGMYGGRPFASMGITNHGVVG